VDSKFNEQVVLSAAFNFSSSLRYNILDGQNMSLCRVEREMKGFHAPIKKFY